MNADEQAIRDAVQEWMDATARGDTARVLQLMDEDVVFLGPGHPPMRGRQAFADAARAMDGKVHVEGSAEVQEIRAFGDWAYAWMELTVTMRPLDGSAPTHRSGPAMSVWRKTGGRWVLFRDANMVTSSSAP